MKKKKTRRRLINLLALLLFLTGAAVLFYPAFSDLWNQYRNSLLIAEYTESVADLDDSRYKEIWRAAKKYNKNHRVNSVIDAFDENSDYQLQPPYDSMLDPNGSGLMGSIEIPKINVKLAIYHGLGKETLENGCGHVEGTSLPTGGKNNHAVLAAHRGLPSAKLFTDLDQLEKGDLFFLHILDKTLAYKVDQIKTVLPSATEELAIVEGKDLVTLVTCTPYGVNTHRLLIRGHRTKYTTEEPESEPLKPPVQADAGPDPKQLLVIGVSVVLIVSIILYFVIKRKKGDRKNESTD